MDNLMTVELVLGPNNTQYQGHNEALARQAALVPVSFPGTLPFPPIGSVDLGSEAPSCCDATWLF